MTVLKYPCFDGERVWDSAAVTMENGFVTSIEACDPAECGEGFLMPGLIDAHVHMESAAQAQALLQHGITTVCDVSAPAGLSDQVQPLRIVSSGGMAMGIVPNPKGFVERAVSRRANYIKVLLFHPLSIGEPALRGIVKAAHARGLKVAVHATEVATVRQAVRAGTDILLHVPMKEPFPDALAEVIAQRGIAVAPTLVMMQAFARSGRNGFAEHHYPCAEQAVRTLHRHGATILAGTDANSGSFAPAVGYGDTLHHELSLLAKTGLCPTEVLATATANTARAFDLSTVGRIAPGKRADLLLWTGRPDRCIDERNSILRVWIGGIELSHS